MTAAAPETRHPTMQRLEAAIVAAAAVPKALALIAARAMSKDPQGRYASAGAMARDLRSWLETRHPAHEAAPVAPVAMRRRWLAGAAGALLLAAGGGWLVVSQRDLPASRLTAAPVAPPKGLVRIDANPWALVEVDGVSLGTAPPLSQLALPVGRHTVTLRHADLTPYSVSIEVAPGQAVEVSHRFNP